MSPYLAHEAQIQAPSCRRAGRERDVFTAAVRR
jgi:hypothetical protein